MAVDPIITDLQYVMETGQELDVLNFYMSFPITCKARVKSIAQDEATLKVQPPGSICLEEQDSTIILSRGLPEAVRARIVEFDLVSGTLKLSDFNYVGARFGDRMIARVQPEDTMEVLLEAGERKQTGTLVDVSLNGVGVYVNRVEFPRGELLQLTLPLPEGQVTLPGKILATSETPDNRARLSIGFTRNAQEIAVVMRYIKDRRTEILAEIERMYDRSYRSKLAQAKDR